MKKLMIAVAFFVTAGLSAQTKGDVEFGFNAGFNYSAVNVSYFQTETGVGFNVGASADYYFSDSWSIKGKLIYDQKGWNEGIFSEGSFDPADPTVNYVTNFNLNYLTIPVMANWHFGSKRNWYLNFGPYAGFLISAKETEGGNDVKESFNKSDFGLALGIGVKIPVSDKLKLFVEYEGQSGFSDILAENPDTAALNSRGSLNVGLNFLLK